MIKYIANERGGIIVINTENLAEARTMQSAWMIDYVYIFDHDGEVILNKKDGTTENFNVKKNDVVLQLYSAEHEGRGEYVILSNDQISNWVERRRRADEEIEKEREARRETCKKCECRDNCEDNSELDA